MNGKKQVKDQDVEQCIREHHDGPDEPATSLECKKESRSTSRNVYIAKGTSTVYTPNIKKYNQYRFRKNFGKK